MAKNENENEFSFWCWGDGRLQDLHRDGNSPVPALFVFTSPSTSPNGRGEYQSIIEIRVLKNYSKKKKEDNETQS